MEVMIKNIGIIERAIISLNGLTIITGYNNTGKSTIRKILYNLFNGIEINFHQENIQRKIQGAGSIKITDNNAYTYTLETTKNKAIIKQFNNVFLINDLFKIDFSCINNTIDFKQNRVLKKINEFVPDNTELEYRDNFNSSLKLFLLIKKLLYSNALTEKTLLIIEEPESHLHPEWQIEVAELLMLLLKDLNVKIVLTTYSPYLLQGLNLFSKKYKYKQNNFYLSRRTKENSVVVDDINNNLDEAYKLFAIPIMRLKELEEEF